AHRLRELGVGPGVAVPLCVRRGADFVLAVVAVSKAGGAYVPLDPDAPGARIAFVIADTGASVVIGNRDALDAANDVTVVDVTEVTGHPTTAPNVVVRDEDLA